ncbi:MAG: universal stress protein [Steroidobacteraceae bacterium]|nr:universal stress protein [Steroidobacteraceae bacterium]MDW8258622.1 universal stress protein [Gammaproteobacteria bacterium]
MVQAIKHVLVAVKDPAQRQQHGVAKAAQIAQRCGAKLTLFHDIALPVYAGAGQLQQELRERRLQELEVIAARLRRHDLEVATAAEWDYPTFEAILRHALKAQADLIVAEVHAGGRHRARWLLAYTDWELLRLSPLPVLLVKSPRLYHRPRILAAVDPLHAYAKPARLDRAILSIANELAIALQGQLHVVHAYLPPVPFVPPLGTGPIIDMGSARDETRRDAAERLEATVASFGIKRGRRHLESGHPTEVIPSVARDLSAGLVVMGAISRSGLKRFFIGNTAESVIDRLNCDILVVKPANFVARIPRAVRGARIVAATYVPG